MFKRGCVHDAPAFGNSQTRVQPLGIGPRLAIDRKHSVEAALEQVLGTDLNHKDAVIGLVFGRVHDKGARHHAFGIATGAEIASGSACPIEIAAGLASGEFHLLGLAGRKLQGVVGLARMLMEVKG